MAVDKNLLGGSTTMLILKLLDNEDMYGYKIIEELTLRSKNVFELKAGTLYPLLHSMELKGLIEAYEEGGAGERVRKYYKITKEGKKFLKEKKNEWKTFTSAVNEILGGENFAYE